MAETVVAPPSDADASKTLQVRGLTCSLPTAEGEVKIVDDVSFDLPRGGSLGIVGESGSGKTMLIRTLTGIGPRRARVTGQVLINGVDLLALPKKERRRLQGSTIGLVFQNPMTALNPVVPVGRQITERMRYHLGMKRSDARDRAVELLTQVGIPDPGGRLRQYPYQLSGGMRQRVTIAAALACNPSVLIADEATTALDVTVQKQILDLLDELRTVRNMSVITISHDLGVIWGHTQDLAVMYSGQMIEKGPTEDVFRRCQHRYTEALMRSVPRLEAEPHTRLATIPGNVRRPSADSVGCRFAARCTEVQDKCTAGDPPIVFGDSASQQHWHRCINPAVHETKSSDDVPVA